MTPEEFPALFAEGWALPKPDAFLEYFMPHFADDAVLIQPAFPVAHGHAEIERVFRGLFTLFPDLSLTVERSAVSSDTVFMSSICATTIGRRTAQFAVCDRFVIRDGKIVERRAFSDPIPTMLAIARSPSHWARALKSRMV